MNTKMFSEAMSEIDSRYVEKTLNYHNKKKKYILSLVASLVFILSCGFAYAAYTYWGVGSADNIDFNRLTQPFGTVGSEQQMNENDSEIFFEKSNLISDYENVYADNSVCVASNNNIIPSIYFSPNYMVIFSQEDEQGWILKAGEKLTLGFSLLQTQSIELEVGYILNGEYHVLSLTKGCDFNETLTVSDEGEYYFCVTNHSSENAIIKSGNIIVERSK